MEKNTAHKICAAAGVCLAAAFLALDLVSLGRLEQLQDKTSELQQDLTDARNRLSDLQREVDGMSRRVAETVLASASLFTRVETDFSYRDGQLLLTLSVVPKDLRVGERVVLSAAGTEDVELTTRDQLHYTGSIAVSPAEEVSPVLSLESPDGRRMEALGPLYPYDSLCLDYTTSYGGDHQYPGDNGDLYILFSRSSQEAPSSLLEDGVLTLSAENSLSSGTRDVPLERWDGLSGLMPDAVCYHADLSTLQTEAGATDLWLELDLGGLVLRDLNPAAGFTNSDEGLTSTAFSGSGLLAPDFP